MRVRIFVPGSDDEIVARDVTYDERTFIGKVDWLRCRGEILALFHELEGAANDNAMPEAVRLEEEIVQLGFAVELPGHGGPAVLSMLHVMNGDDVVFRLVAPERWPAR